ncbi:MAG: hypothetical protein IJF41_03490, partial [Clostridia bacterium]|nr:hypothetical protein [Clostridia bacterium]
CSLFYCILFEWDSKPGSAKHPVDALPGPGSDSPARLRSQGQAVRGWSGVSHFRHHKKHPFMGVFLCFEVSKTQK